MTTLTLAVDRGLPESWDRLAPPPSASRRRIELLDRFGPGHLTFTLHADGRPVLAMGGTVIENPLPRPRMDPYHILSGRSAHLGLIPDGPHPWRGIPAAKVMPCLLFMHPDYSLFPVGPVAQDPAMLAAFLAQARRWAAAHGLTSLAFLYISTSAGSALRGALSAAGAAMVPLTSRCHMAVSWPDFAGYLAALPKKHRGSVRHELRTLAEREVVLTEEKAENLASPELLGLRCQLVAKYSNHYDTEHERRLLENIAAKFTPEEICLTTARRSGRLLGFGLFLQDGEEWTAFLTGTDYQDPGSRLTYFATSFYLPATLAPGRGVRGIDYGLGSWEAKRLRGCALTPSYAAALPADPAGSLPEPGTGSGRGGDGTGG